MSHEQDQHVDDFLDQQYDAMTIDCDGCRMTILRTEVVSPADWAESFCVLCLSGVPEVL